MRVRQKPRPNINDDSKPRNIQQDDHNSLLQLDPNQLANITTTNNPTGEQSTATLRNRPQTEETHAICTNGFPTFFDRRSH